MSSKLNGGAAFPLGGFDGTEFHTSEEGMSLRSYFAAQALPVAITQIERFTSSGTPGSPVWLRDRQIWAEKLARLSVEIADAMVARLK